MTVVNQMGKLEKLRSRKKQPARDLAHPDLYINRELSELEFHRRVLFEAVDQRNPLLDRVKFLAIFSSNMDEFFMKRVGGLKRQIAARVTDLTPDGRTPVQQWEESLQTAHRLLSRQMECYKKQIRPALKSAGISILHHKQLDNDSKAFLRDYFESNVLPILTPLAVDPGHPFPFISNLSLSLAVMIRREPRGEPGFTRIKIPQNRPRLVRVKDSTVFVPLEQIVAANLDLLFPNVKVVSRYPFRVTRNADVKRNEEEASDLLEMIQEELRRRRFATVVRLEVDERMPDSMREMLRIGLKVSKSEIFPIDGLIGFNSFLDLHALDRPELKSKPWVPRAHPRLRPGPLSESADMFREIRRKDILVHHPYHSFSESVQRFVETASRDPQVLAIKMVIYRTARESKVLQSLLEAVKNGKQVAVMVELRARFNEELNIGWVHMLEEAGVHVAYGIVGYKTHAKVTLVVREEPQGLQRYVHVATGNYHSETANVYTDLGLLTASEEVGRDVGDLFNVLTGHAGPQGYRRLLVAPATLRSRFLELIRNEARLAQRGRKGRIVAKMNSLEDPQIIQELYRASIAGVEIDLIVRGICCLKPGLKHVSKTIRVISVVGRFLEHSRIFSFHNDGDPVYLIGSADWMHRNLDFRIEATVPISDPDLKKELDQALTILLSDNRKAWDMESDGTYRQRRPREKEAERNAHEILMQRAEDSMRETLAERIHDHQPAVDAVSQAEGLTPDAEGVS